MKLAGLGALAGIVGLVLGVDGLAITGAFWLVTGFLAAIVIRRREDAAAAGAAAGAANEAEVGRIEGAKDSQKRYRILGLALLLVIGLGSIAIGLFEVGFTGEYESLRWIPLGGGILVTAIALITLPVRFGAVDLEAVSRGGPTTPATVTIEGRSETGTYINERPRIEFDLLVEPEDRPAYRVKKKATVPPTAIGNIAVGDGFDALVGSEDDSNIAIDWDSPIEGTDADPSERLERLEDLRRRDLISAEEYDVQRKRILGSI